MKEFFVFPHCDGKRIEFKKVQGTIRTETSLIPKPSAAATNISYHKLLAIGDVTGTTAFGFGDPTKPTTGLMASFGRTSVASATLTDTGADIRVINKVTNTGTNTLQAGYFKAKNYSSGTVGGDLIGLFVETVNDGTVTGKTVGIKIGKDTGAITADIIFSNGTWYCALATAITANSTTTSAPIGSIATTSHATGAGKWFISDGSKWQYAVVTG